MVGGGALGSGWPSRNDQGSVGEGDAAASDRPRSMVASRDAMCRIEG